MADDLNKPSFYPRVGNIRPKKSSPLDAAVNSIKQVFTDDRAMELPFGQYDLSVPTKANRELSNRMVEREIDLKRQADQDMSPLEKIAAGLQTGRLFGSALTQAVNSVPTRIVEGNEAGDKFMQDRMYRPTQPKAYEYAGNVGDFLEQLETQYKIPPIIPELAALQGVAGPATRQAAQQVKRGAKAGAMAGRDLVGNAINDAMVYNQGPLAAITPQPMRMSSGPQAKGSVMPQNLQRMREEIRAKAEQDKILQDAYNQHVAGIELNQRPSMEEFKATSAQPSQAELDQMRLDLDEQNFAGGGVAKLAKLLRAPAKTKQEIEAIAERMAPQVTGEYVRGSKGAKTVAGKTQKQFEREKTLEHDIRPTDGERPLPKDINIEELKDSVMMGIAGDPTITGQTVYSVAGRKLRSPAPQHGGPLYGLENDDRFWASNLGAAQGVQNRAGEVSRQYDAPVVGSYVKMGPDSYSYAQHFGDTNLQNIRPEEMTRAQIDAFDQLVRQGSKKSGPRPTWPGIENPDLAYLHMAVDPELRKHFGNLMQMPTVTERLGLPSGLDVAHAVTEPDLRNLEIGVTGKSMGRMRPDVKNLKLSEHPTYTHDIPGEFLGGMKFPVPYELSFPDSLKAVRENPDQAPQEFGSFKMAGPRQVIDQQLIDEIKAYEERMRQLTGKKDGGAVTMAEGGEISADDLILEERPL